MPQIELANKSLLDAAICMICPGGLKIYPASALAEHQDSVHGPNGTRDKVFWFPCKRCGERFHHALNEGCVKPRKTSCAKCSGNSGQLKKYKPRVRTKQMSKTGIEKNENVNTRRGASY